MQLQIRPDDPNLTWQGAISLQRADAWVMPWRIPYNNRALFPPTLCGSAQRCLPGYDSPSIATHRSLLVMSTQTGGSSGIDLYCDGQFHGSASLTGQESFLFEALPSGEKLIELWLPQFGEVRLRFLELSPGATIAPYEDLRPRWVAYGSSITHCRTAERPGETWPAIVAREHGLNLTCLGVWR